MDFSGIWREGESADAVIADAACSHLSGVEAVCVLRDLKTDILKMALSHNSILPWFQEMVRLS